MLRAPRSAPASGLVFALLFGACALFVPNFLSHANVEGLLLSVSTIGLVACTMLFCLASGSFDLSVGSTVACTGVVCAVVLRDTGSLAFGVLAALATGLVVGLVNGAAVAYGKLNPLITTLATMQIVRGAGYIANDGKAIGIGDERFFALGSARPLAGVPLLDFPLPVWIAVFAMLAFGLLLARTTFGRATLAIGGNPEAARLAGLPVERVQLAIFALQGLVCAGAGLVLAARMTSGQPMSSQGLELEVISACVLGGVSLAGGTGSMLAVVAGVLILGLVQNAMSLLNIDSFWQYVARGSILLGAVLFDRWRSRR
ncbi:MAG: L-arabinose ABC transporter permease AraH [Planctomycetes bacterium]|nr:L-arabinose ABC transporter permease AraH [Planctomycetota bacterium]